MVAPFFLPWFLVGLVHSSSSERDDLSSSKVGINYLEPFSLELHDFVTTGRGVRTKIDRRPGEILLQIPVKDSITTAATSSSRPTMDQSMEWTQEQSLSLGILQMRDDGHPYVTKMLPKSHASLWTMPDDLWRSVAGYIPKSYRETVQATRDSVLEFSNGVNDFDDSYSKDDVLWSFSMIRSRSIAVPELQEQEGDELPIALIPGLDLFNHAFDAGTLLQLVDNQWTLTSSRAYSAGDQIHLSYGDDKDNWKLLLTYGFTVPSNPNALAFWTWEELLTAAGQVRPAMFSDPVKRSLLRHPQLQIYVEVSENRATFSYDLRSQAPRESLQNGLTMLSSLATQLGFPHDKRLPEDVMKQLLRNRIDELVGSQTGLTSAIETRSDKWASFVGSIKSLLEEEANCLADATIKNTS